MDKKRVVVNSFQVGKKNHGKRGVGKRVTPSVEEKIEQIMF